MGEHKQVLRTPLGRVKGLGQHSGAHHWWVQRLSAVALVPLGLWFIVTLAHIAGLPVQDVRAYLAEPLHVTLMILFLVAGLHHAQLGLQVIIEDYVHCGAVKFALLIGIKFLAVGLGVLGAVCLFAIARM